MSRSARLGLRGRSIRLRFTAMYMALFLLSGVALLGITVLLSVGTTQAGQPRAASRAGRGAAAHRRA
jgi:hypothetical protein